MDDRIGMSRYPCKYPNCGNKYYTPIYKADYYNKRFYRFPKNAAVADVWKDICNIERSTVTRHYFICEDHFATKDFMNHTKQRLKVGVIPRKPIRSFTIKDHDYMGESSTKDEQVPLIFEASYVSQSINRQHHKYEFLFDNNVDISVYVGSSCADSQTKQILMLNIHQSVSLKCLELKNVLSNETYILQKLIWMYKDGKFDSINQQLVHVSNEFLQCNLESSPPVILKTWTEEDHFLALRLYNWNEKLYKYLCCFFHLPLVKKLQHLLFKFPLKTGIDLSSLQRMKGSFGKMNGGNRCCVLLMEEMMLTRGINYDESCQHFCGYEDLGLWGRSAKPADRVIVFMARGLRKNWTQIVSYYFMSGPLKDVHLQNIIVEAVKCLQNLNLSVIAFVCQQNATNLKALSLLTTKIEDQPLQSFFYVSSIRILIIFDARYLLKDTRNAFTKCKVLFDEEGGKVAELSYIESAYNLDQSKRIFKQLYNLEDKYFKVNDSSDKVDFSAAAAIFSYTVAASIETFVLTGDLPQEAMNTAEFAAIMDTLFDSLTGSERKPEHYRKYHCALSMKSPHLKLWSSYLEQIRKWKLIELTTEQDVTNQYSFINGWLVTMESLSYLWRYLKHVDYYYYLSLKRFNLEPLEDLFKKIARYSATDKSPTSYQFLATLKCVILNEKDNPWINDDCYNLTVSKTFIDSLFKEDAHRDKFTEVYFDDLNFDIINNYGFHEEAAYLSGYLLQKINIPECVDCRSLLLAEWAISDVKKEYGDNSTYSIYASDAAVRIADRILFLLGLFLEERSNNLNLGDNFKALHKRELDSFKSCSIHSCNKEFINLCVKFGIYKFSYKFNNRIQNK